MKKVITVVVTAVLFVGVSVFAQGMSDSDQIRNARDQFNNAIARHDVQAIMSFHDDEYQITTSLGQLIQGRDGEADSWQELFSIRQDVLYVRTPETIEMSDAYPLAAETGTWVGTWSTPDGGVRTGGRYSAMWRQVDGEWKVRSELFVALYCEGLACP